MVASTTGAAVELGGGITAVDATLDSTLNAPTDAGPGAMAVEIAFDDTLNALADERGCATAVGATFDGTLNGPVEVRAPAAADSTLVTSTEVTPEALALLSGNPELAVKAVTVGTATLGGPGSDKVATAGTVAVSDPEGTSGKLEMPTLAEGFAVARVPKPGELRLGALRITELAPTPTVTRLGLAADAPMEVIVMAVRDWMFDSVMMVEPVLIP